MYSKWLSLYVINELGQLKKADSLFLILREDNYAPYIRATVTAYKGDSIKAIKDFREILEFAKNDNWHFFARYIYHKDHL